MKKIIALILALIMVMGLAVSASADAPTASITITPADPGNGTVAEGAPIYTVYKIFDAVLGGELNTNPTDTPNASVPVTYTIAAGSKYITDLAGCFTFEDIPGDTSKKVAKINSGVTAADIVAALNGKLANPETVTATVDGDGNYIFSGLTPGYYVITSSVGSAMIVDTLEDVTVESKNSYPTITKTADKTTAAFGEKVTYTLSINVPATAVGTITVHDTMTGLTYNGDAVAKAGEDAVDLTPVTGEDHTHCTVELTFNAAAVAGKTVTITYSADVAANTVNTNNQANIVYGKFTSENAETTTTNYKIDVYKYTGSETDKIGLAGAGFVLKNAEGKYYSLADGKISWVDSVDQATEYTTAEAGNYIITFAGLANGTYTLVENTVPAGYNKAADREIIVNGADWAGDKQVGVLNNTGSELPSTGGMGTTLFYVFGGLMMTGAAVLLITKKRMSV